MDLDDGSSALRFRGRANGAVQFVSTINTVADLQADDLIGKLPGSSFGVFIDKLATVIEAPTAACRDSRVGRRRRIGRLERALRRARREIGRGRVFGRYSLVENGGVDVGTALKNRKISTQSAAAHMPFWNGNERRRGSSARLTSLAESSMLFESLGAVQSRGVLFAGFDEYGEERRFSGDENRLFEIGAEVVTASCI